MTFTELRTEILDRLNLSSTEATTRVGRAINRKYRLITSTIGLQLSRRATISQAVTLGVSTVTFTNTEKIINVFNRAVTPYRRLEEVTIDELEHQQPFTASDSPSKFAIWAHTADTVTILVNCIPQTAFTLYADVHTAVSDLSGSTEPAFPESFHDIIIEGVMADELRKMEKPKLAEMAQTEYDRILSDLRMWIAKSGYLDIYQNKMEGMSRFGGGAGGGGSSSINGALSYTQTGLITFDRDPSDPFAVTSGSGKVDNLDADLLDGQEGTAYHDATLLTGVVDEVNGGTGQSTITQGDLLYGSASNVISKLAKNASASRYLSNTGGSNNPAWAQIILTDGVTGTLPVANGGTGVASLTANRVPYGNGTGALQSSASFTFDGTTFTTPGQIAFPASQSASGNANTLDDYEEGTWTPTLIGAGGQSGQAYSVQLGRYTKIGNLVHIQGEITMSTLGTLTTQVLIGGLPFTSSASGGRSVAHVGYWFATTATFVFVAGYIQLAATSITLVGAKVAATGVASIIQTDFSDTTQLLFSASYVV